MQFTAGGRWTDRLQPSVRQNLRWFWFDGVFAQASEAIVLSYLSLFVLALGANRAQIGLFIPEDRRPRYSALYHIIVMAALAGGAAVGGVVADAWGYRTVFVLSGIGRFGAALSFAWSVRRTIGR